MKNQSFIGVGSNLGNRQANCRAALDRLGCLADTVLQRVSTVVESEPQEGVEGGPFLNAVAEIATSLSPRQLLGQLRAIEAALGRAPDHLPGTARTMDLDLLLYGDAVIRETDLTIPHPRLAERWFVLAPLVTLDPELRHPVLQVTMANLLRGLDPEAPRVSPGRVR